ncbi:probable galacturonosyltransferase 15 [Asparagus officinalis]|uniref:probable galacturonosyltransferase 15 n=1 Tax=Asparagus officinalis TaxID=4686 RepID=UPI00098E811D|nr:probable galacturonosyltransferase 15 [Asparagus officinalis]
MLFRGSDTSLELMKELRRVYIDAEERGEVLDEKFIESAPESLDHLLAEIAGAAASYQHIDIKTFLLKTKAMLIKMDHKVQLSRNQASIYQHLASIGVPKSIHCVTLNLAEEYLVNAIARTSLPLPEHSYRLTNANYLHIVIITDNILAASVAISSTVKSSKEPGKFVFHIVTDKKTSSAMHAWFSLNSVFPAVVEVKGLHQFDWPPYASARVMVTVEEVHQGLMAYREYSGGDEDYRRLEGLSPNSFLLLNYLRIHLPELFPNLKRVILLDDDVVVQRDLTPLWDLDLNDNIIGAVGLEHNRESHCPGPMLGHYFNFSNSLLPSELEQDQCAWLGGMNIFDLEAWSRTNITATFQQMLRLNRESGFLLWRLGWLPPAIIAFNSKVHPIDPSWQLPGLGQQLPAPETLKTSAVLHFSGPRKPWLEIGFPELRNLWMNHLNHSDEFLTSCRVV